MYSDVLLRFRLWLRGIPVLHQLILLLGEQMMSMGLPWVGPIFSPEEFLILSEDIGSPIYPQDLLLVVYLPPFGFLEVNHEAAIWMIRYIHFFERLSGCVMLKLEPRIPRLYLAGFLPFFSNKAPHLVFYKAKEVLVWLPFFPSKYFGRIYDCIFEIWNIVL